MIPTRDELIERANAYLAGLPEEFRRRSILDREECMADFALAEGRRMVAEEMDALRKWIGPPDYDTHISGLREREIIVEQIDARLSALRAEPTKVGEFAGIPIMADPSVKPGTVEGRAASSLGDGVAGPTRCKRCARELDGLTLADVRRLESPPPSSAESDARALERAAAKPCPAEHRAPRAFCSLLSGHHGRHRTSVGMEWPNENEQRPCTSTMAAALGVVGMPCLLRCGLLMDHDGQHVFALSWEELRAAAPEPEVDVFEAFSESYGNTPDDVCLTSYARDWFGPLVEAAEADSRLCDCDGHPSVEVDAHRTSCRGQRSRLALSALRRRATEARS